MAQRLNQKIVDALGEGQTGLVWDAAEPGFGVWVGAKAKSYIVQYRAAGRSKRVTLGSTSDFTYSFARAKAAEVLLAARRGADVLAPAQADMRTFREVCDEWIAHGGRDGRTRAPSTIRDYKDRCERLIYPAIGDRPLGQISRAEVERHLTTYGSQHRSRSYAVTIIKAAYNYAVRARYLTRAHENPAEGIRTIKGPGNQRVLTLAEIERFGATLAAMEAANEVSPHLAALLRVSLLCGLRPGEAKSLTWDRIDAEHQRIEVVGKTGRRAVPLSEAALTALMRVPRIEGVDYVFAGRVHGKHLTGVAKQLDRIAGQAGIARFAPYAFRHTAATQALVGGADVRAVQALLGHADLKTTAGYLHATEERQRAAADRVASFAKGL